MKRILVPTDFSECAKCAAEAAIQLAKRLNGEVHFLHFMSIPMNWIHLEIDQDQLYPDIKADISEANKELKALQNLAHKVGVTAKYFLDYSESQAHTIKYIKENKIDLVVMGSHGASGFRELFIGTNAQKVVRLSPVPVLIVKSCFDLEKNARIIFVSDFEPEVMHAFENVMNFATQIGAKLNLVYVNTPAYFRDTWEIKEKMESFSFLGQHNVESSDIIDTYVYEDGLEKYCENLGGGIVTMATHGRKGISRVIYGSLTEKVVNHLTIPVMSYKICDEYSIDEPDLSHVY
jgi:nucleotide-binding universal stress UspA family protein